MQQTPTPSMTSISESSIPRTDQHKTVGITAPIPQGSPPIALLQTTQPPIYYSDYLNPDAAQALFYLSFGVVYESQVSATTIYCDNYATAEHVSCDRQVSPVWTYISYLDIFKTQHYIEDDAIIYYFARRAIDCLYCRQYIMDNAHRVNHLIIQILCNVTVFL